MKKLSYLFVAALLLCLCALAQVTKINSNQSLTPIGPLNSVQTLFYSGVDGALWVSEGDLVSTIKLSTSITTGGEGNVYNGKFIFAGATNATGEELYVTDGTPAGTVLFKELEAGSMASSPSDFITHNGFLYFSAETAVAGRELWRTDGTAAGTVMIKDINAGVASSNTGGDYGLTPLGNQLIFTAVGNANGFELWKTDGTSAGTLPVKDINPGSANSDPNILWPLGNVLVFTATTAANGREVWRTDGTEAGTYILKDINVGAASSTEIEIFPGFTLPLTMGFHVFNNKAYFLATDGINTGNLYTTDGTAANTTLVKTLISGLAFPQILLVIPISLPDKFFFSLSDGISRSEIWQSNGTTAGTTLFKAFDYNENYSTPVLFKNFTDFNSLGNPDVLFQGNTFFFSAYSSANGNELWKSDGTLAGTQQVKDVLPGNGSGIADLLSYMYTSSALFFAATNGTNGMELWRSNGTSEGTVLVQDIKPGTGNSDPELMLINNNKVFFGANDGDAQATDLFVVDGMFAPLPANLSVFSAVEQQGTVRTQWETLTETGTAYFSVERSNDGRSFSQVGTVQAAGRSVAKRQYSFTDNDVVFPPGDRLYYRLATYDNAGAKTYSKIVAVAGRTSRWQARLYANEPGGNTVLQLDGLLQPAFVKLTDLNGKVLFSRNCDVRQWLITLPVQQLPKGVYLVSIQHGNEVRTLKVVQ